MRGGRSIRLTSGFGLSQNTWRYWDFLILNILRRLAFGSGYVRSFVGERYIDASGALRIGRGVVSDANNGGRGGADGGSFERLEGGFVIYLKI